MRSPTTRSLRCGPRSPAGSRRRASGARSKRPMGAAARRHARGSATGPPAAAGRWSSTAPLFEPVPTPTESITQRALQLLERYGVLTREMALAEGAEGGFAGVYPVLKVLEERGQVRRGYFVDGLGAAQFAKPGAVDLLRAAGEDTIGVDPDPDRPPAHAVGTLQPRNDRVRTGGSLAATDPPSRTAQRMAWPESTGHPARAVGAYVVLIDGARVRLPGARRQAAPHLPGGSGSPRLDHGARRSRAQRPGGAPAHRVDRRRLGRSFGARRRLAGVGIRRRLQGAQPGCLSGARRAAEARDECRRGGTVGAAGPRSERWGGVLVIDRRF